MMVDGFGGCVVRRLRGAPAIRLVLMGASALAGLASPCGAALAQQVSAPPTAAQSADGAPAAPAGSQLQSPTATPAGSDPTAEPTGVAEVVVTAQRREERLQDVPIAITAISSADLQRNHINDASRLTVITPGLIWGQQGSDSFPAIRGVRTSLVSAQNDPVIGFYLDGVYQSRTQQQSIPLFDLSRVEVQRGPQGTLYGRNTFGGNLSVISNAPTKAFDAGILAEGGNYGHVRTEGFVNIPVSDTLQVRVSGVYSKHDGYVNSTTPGVSLVDEDQNAERVNVKWKPTDRLQVDLHYTRWDREDAGSGSYGYKVAGTLINPATGFQSINGVPFAVNPSVHNGTAVINGVDIGVPVTGGAYTNDWDYQPFEKIVENAYAANVSYDLGFATVRSITAYTDFAAHRSADNDQSSVVFGDQNGFGSGQQEPNTRDNAFSQELQLASNSSKPFQWIVGGYFLHDEVYEVYQQKATAPGSDVTGFKEFTNLHTNAYAAYAQASYYVVPDLVRLIGGVRYSQETKNFKFADYVDAPPNTYNFVTPYSRTSGNPSFDKTTWRAGIEFTPDRNSMYYATASTGFESGGVNDTGGSPAIPSSYAPQTVSAYEVGAKNRFLEGRVQTNVAVFYNDFNNLQINVYTPQVSYFGSAGKANSYGVETEVKTLPIQNLHVDFTTTLFRGRYTQYISGNNFYGRSNGQDPVFVNLAGKDIPQTPSFKSTVAVYYDLNLGPYGTVSPYLDWVHSSSYFTTDFNTALDKQDRYDQLDLTLRWTNSAGKYYVEGYGNNVTNIPVLFSAVVGRAERVQVSYGPPATYGVRIGARF